MSREPRRILVPTDFSAASDRAVKLAKGLATQFDAEIHLLHVRQFGYDPYVEQALRDKVERLLKPGTDRAGKSLREIAENDGGLTYVPHVEHGYSIADAILDSIGGYDCDLVVMGTHGRRPWSRILMGSVANRVVRLSPAPVITTHADVEGHLPPRKILVAYDSSEASLEAVRSARAWSSAFGARAVLLHAVEPVIYPGFYTVDAVRSDCAQGLEHGCEAALEKTASELLSGIDSECVVIRETAARGITTYAREHDCDLVVLATHGLSGVAHVLLGSVAERVVRTADVPVLTVRSKTLEG